MKTSEPVMTSPSEPVRRSLFVSRAISSFEKSMCSARPSKVAPCRSQRTTSPIPRPSSSLVTAIPAAPRR